MARILNLIRHGAVLPSGHGQFIGSSDLPLNEEGQAQARSLAEFLEVTKTGLFWVSPLARARQTAELAVPDVAFEVVQDIREVDFGRWERKTFEQISVDNPDMVQHWCDLDSDFAFPDGESLPAFQDRLRRVAQLIADAPEDVATIIAHGGVIRGLICHYLGLSFKHYLLFNVALGSLSTIALYDGKGVLNSLSVRPPA